MSEFIITNSNMRTSLSDIPENTIDACVTDPPYELNFQNNSWDRSGVSFQKETWETVFRVLKPGSYAAIFGGTRTWHRIAVAVEDAGFEIRDTLMWLYGSGMPKSYNPGNKDGYEHYGGLGTSLKPAWEPIIVARRPIQGSVLNNLDTYGTGCLNIDDTRIPTTDSYVINRFDSGMKPFGNAVGETYQTYEQPDKGRWPSNLLLDEDAANGIDKISGISTSVRTDRGRGIHGRTFHSPNGTSSGVRGHNDSGGASRYFWVKKANRLEKSDANHHPTVKPIELMEYIVKMVVPKGGSVIDPFMGSGSTGVAALLNDRDFIGVELIDSYYNTAHKRLSDVFVDNQY